MALALLGVLLFVGCAALIAVGEGRGASEPVTIKVLGDTGTPYEITYENSENSYTDRGVVPAEYKLDVSTRRSARDYVWARASKLEEAKNVTPTEGDLVNVDLQLVAEDGAVFDEQRGDGMLSYSLNQTSVGVDGDDIR